MDNAKVEYNDPPALVAQNEVAFPTVSISTIPGTGGKLLNLNLGGTIDSREGREIPNTTNMKRYSS